MPRVFQQGPCGTSSLSGVSLVDVGGWGGGSVSGGGGTAGPVPPTPTPCILAHKGRCTRSTPASRVCPTHRPVKDRCRAPPPSWPGPIWQALPEAPVSSLGPLWAVSDRELGPVRHTSTQTDETGSRSCGICYHESYLLSVIRYVLFKKDFTGDAEAAHKSLVSSFSSYL